MNQQDRELVCQYLDEEMGVAERNHFEQRLAAEAELRDTLQSYRAVDSHLRRAMAREGHVPVTVAALLAASDDRVAVLPARRRQTWGLAVAASLLAGVVIINGPQWLADSRDNLLVPNIQESVAFSQILEESPSRAKGWLPVADDVAMRPVLSFASNGGTWCREFLAAQGREAWRGVACRRDHGWDVELLVQTPGLAAENTGYHTASAETADMVANFIDTHSADIPLGPEQEASLIARDWRSAARRQAVQQGQKFQPGSGASKF